MDTHGGKHLDFYADNRDIVQRISMDRVEDNDTIGATVGGDPGAGLCRVFYAEFAGGVTCVLLPHTKWSHIYDKEGLFGFIWKVQEYVYDCVGEHLPTTFLCARSNRNLVIEVCPSWDPTTVTHLLTSALNASGAHLRFELWHNGNHMVDKMGDMSCLDRNRPLLTYTIMVELP